MKKILAVSGGIDSMVMLHLLRKDSEAVVAHFDHGIRESSQRDAEFVGRMAKAYGLPFYAQQGQLGPNCSESHAREARYEFLSLLAERLNGQIYIAHHRNDVQESIIINLLRGTGWRGLTPMGNSDIVRPLIHWSKSDIYRYAANWQIVWRQDQTNTDDKFLRNRIRLTLGQSSIQDMSALEKILKLSLRQTELRKDIEELIESLLPQDDRYERVWFKEMDDMIALEILRAALNRIDKKATRPELSRFLQAIRFYGSNKYFNLSGDYLVHLRKTHFVLQ